jgi:hypothetical protein
MASGSEYSAVAVHHARTPSTEERTNAPGGTASAGVVSVILGAEAR